MLGEWPKSFYLFFLNCKTFLVSWSYKPKVPCYVCKIQDVCVMYVATCFSLLLLLFFVVVNLIMFVCTFLVWSVHEPKKSTEMKRNKIYWNYYFKKTPKKTFNSKTGLGLNRLHVFVLHHSLLLFGWFKLYLCVLWSVSMCPWTKKVKRTELNCTEIN